MTGSVPGFAFALLLCSWLRIPGDVSTKRNHSAACRPADTVIVPERVRYFTYLLTTPDSTQGIVRDSLRLPRLQTVDVHLVDEASLCTRAGMALDTQRQELSQERHLWVYDLGEVGYAVEDPDIPGPSGQYQPIYLFDRRWRYRVTLAGL